MMLEHVPDACFNYGAGAESLDQAVLDVEGFIRDRNDTISGVFVCKPCAFALQNGTTPRLALANGLWVGRVPVELRGLTWAEEKLIALAHVSVKIYKCRSRSVADDEAVQRAIHSNVITFPTDAHVVKTLPLSVEKLHDLVKVVFIEKRKPSKTIMGKLFVVRK